MRAGFVESNPFSHLKTAVKGNKKRFRFVTLDDYAALIDASPDDDWKCTFSLARIGGVRVPSEILPLSRGMMWTGIASESVCNPQDRMPRAGRTNRADVSRAGRSPAGCV